MNETRLEYWKLSRELAVMLDIVLRRETPIPDDLDWDRFKAAVARHRLQPLLIRGLRNTDVETLLRCPVLKQYRARHNQYAMESYQRLCALSDVGTAFAREGIRMLSMKGPLLAMELYGDPSMRTSRDLDVMVPEEDLEKAGRILTGLGYAEEENLFHRTPLRRKFYSLIEQDKHEIYCKGSICIELHWKDNYQAEEAFDDLWANRQEQQVLGRPIAILGPEDRYPALVIHAAEHGFCRLRWLLDLYELQKKPGFSWEPIWRQMQARGVGELLLETLVVMYRLALPGLPDLAWDGFSLSREDGGICLRLSEELEEAGRRALALSEAVFPLWEREVRREEALWKDYDRLLPVCMIRKTPLQKLLLAAGPSTHELALIDLPDPLFWLYFLIRPFYWLWRKLTGAKKA